MSNLRQATKLFFLCCLLTTAICEVGVYQPEEGEQVVEFDPKSQLTINAKQNSLFTVKIRGSPTTGYGWYLENAAALNGNLLKPLNLNKYYGSKDYISDPHPPGWVGGGGYYYFRFQAVNAGEATLNFVNKRPWDPSSRKSYEVRVTIN